MLQAGQVLHKRYKLQQKLGQNAGRQTWLAEDLAAQPAGEPVIVKLLSFGGDVQWDDLKLFEREAQVLQQLSHTRIPKYRDYFSIDDRTLWFGLVQEYIPGTSFKELLNQGRKFTETELRKIAEDLLQILVYLHELNPPVLHRDIKPSNLIWGEDERVYLVDFGAVQDKAAAEGATFTVVGTYGYAPVEQFGGRAVPASDLYALGATLIHLATGTSPADLPQRDMRIQFSDRVSLSPSFASWIGHLTEPALERRFISAGVALAALQSGVTAQSTSQPASSPPTGKIRPPRNTRVVVNKSPDIIEIFIPEGWMTHKNPLFFILKFSLKLCALLFLTFSLLKAISLVIAVLALAFLWSAVQDCIRFWGQHTQISLNRNSNRFEMEWRWFGRKIYEKKWVMSDIWYACCSTGKGNPKVLLRGESGHDLSFGKGLSEVECAWLAQEIQTWLNLK
ncbi:serine/threonine protein kinase [Kamptonema formosum]|uniref:serine/threonine protein kinase n=1 Tax=Kamptonema formosum TaxID=331992 RepID=UPI00034640D3|nr:serine/threonine-protein kinase [Oscillatoria sp. PCC 10802]